MSGFKAATHLSEEEENNKEINEKKVTLHEKPDVFTCNRIFSNETERGAVQLASHVGSS